MNNIENTNWYQSVGCVIIKDKKVLLCRHTYGSGKGNLIIPGGYLNKGELPEEAAVREVFEETSIKVKIKDFIGIRCRRDREWYAIFSGEYISGTPKSDGDENSEVVWLDVETALQQSDVPDMSKQAIISAYYRPDKGFNIKDFPKRNGDPDFQFFTSK